MQWHGSFARWARTRSASTVLRVDVGQLSQLATNIVGGHITNIAPEKNSDNGYIYSKVTLRRMGLSSSL